jgi:predicted acylesterase/phospholipase RssA
MSIPGVFSPVLHEDDILVDGGVMNNFPVDIMDEICGGGTIIGVNVGQTHEPAETDAFDVSISGWQVLWSRINPFTKPRRLPTIGSTLIRSMEISSAYQLKMGESLADVLIEPDVMQFGTLDFGAYEEIIELGYQAALEKLVQFENLKGSSV